MSDLDICCDFLFVCTLSWLILKSFFLIGQRNFAHNRWTNQRSVFELRSAVATLLCAKNPNSPISHLKLHHQHQSAPFWTKITFWILVRLRDTFRYLVIPTKPIQNQWQIFSYNQTQITGGISLEKNCCSFFRFFFMKIGQFMRILTQTWFCLNHQLGFIKIVQKPILSQILEKLC